MSKVLNIFGNQFPLKVIPEIDNAKISIDIIVFDWRWYFDDIGNPVQKFNQALIRASKRGVKIRAVTNMDDVIDVLKKNGIACMKPLTKKLIHPKLMIIDSKILIIGSHNYTQSAFTTNYEVSIMVLEPENLQELKTFFNNLYGYG